MYLYVYNRSLGTGSSWHSNFILYECFSRDWTFIGSAHGEQSYPILLFRIFNGGLSKMNLFINVFSAVVVIIIIGMFVADWRK